MKWILFGLFGLGIGVFWLNEPLPVIDPKTCEQADIWAKKIEQAIDRSAWESTEVITWTFVGKNHHIWDKKRKLHSLVKGDETIIQSLHSRKAIKTQNQLQWDTVSQKEKDRAYNTWINDSFWLNPLTKLFDEGTQRYIVHIDGKKGLMISYMQGGLTPGDSYVWFTDQKNRPTQWKLWVSVIPIGGLENSWEGWIQLSTGAWVSTKHNFGIATMELSDVQGGLLGDLFDIDPFRAYCQRYPSDC